MFLVGLTGGIASGKSSVIQVFQQLGCAVIDVDVIARHVVQPGYPAHRRIVEAFGTEVLLENGDINRKVLGDLIFNQPDRRHLLNTITHPEIRKEMMKETFKYFLRGSRSRRTQPLAPALLTSPASPPVVQGLHGRGSRTSQLLGALTSIHVQVSEAPPAFQGYRYVILDIPLLFETKQLLKYMAHTVVVYWNSSRPAHQPGEALPESRVLFTPHFQA
ncbi:dephospho-CoA kinase domain-containing protein isoform X5 [Ursus maritimus]|uniref:Dephospho-CoA kinase domain-containing protein isoform X5 n=1 Tax=Ursus maritimus TaxID=29073 RepID=A0A8M1GN26_URSMA|nr:dephospho-CoA kinase domain-containing protein isoform X5 [Ursus maritimus]